MRTRASLANLLLILGALTLLLALPALPAPAVAAPLMALTETAEPTVVTATPTSAPTATATIAPTATQTAAPTNTPTPAAEEQIARADPAVTKRSSVSEARVGDLVTFTITVTNRGNADAHDVVVEDDLPAFLELVSASATRGGLSTTPRGARLFLGRVSPGDEVVMEVVARAIAPALPPDNRNQVTLSAASGGDNLSNNQDEAALLISGGAALLTPTPEAATVTPEALTATPEMPTATADGAAAPPARLPSTGGAAPAGPPAAFFLALTMLTLGAALRWRR